MRFAWAMLAFVASLAGAQAVAQPALFPPPGEMITSPTEELPEGKFDPPSSPWKPPVALEPTPAGLQKPEDEDTPAEAGSPGARGEKSDLKKDDGAADVIVDEKRTWYQRVFLIVPEPWDTGVELGLNGSAGTSDSFSMRTGGYIKRQSRFSKLDTSLYYNRTGSGGVITQNNAQFDVRNDWLLDDKSPWTLFGTNSVFYDQFKDFDLQTNVDGGVGYRFYHEKELELIGAWVLARRVSLAARMTVGCRKVCSALSTASSSMRRKKSIASLIGFRSWTTRGNSELSPMWVGKWCSCSPQI